MAVNRVGAACLPPHQPTTARHKMGYRVMAKALVYSMILNALKMARNARCTHPVLTIGSATDRVQPRVTRVLLRLRCFED